MTKIVPFDIKYRSQIECGEYKVKYEDAYGITDARIVCWDVRCWEFGEQVPILALINITAINTIKDAVFENPKSFREDGIERSGNGKLIIEADNEAGDELAVFDFQKRFEELMKEGEQLIEKLKASR